MGGNRSVVPACQFRLAEITCQIEMRTDGFVVVCTLGKATEAIIFAILCWMKGCACYDTLTGINR